VFVQGETVMEGYLDNPEADKKSFHDGWFRTGDLASCDSEGRLWFAGRLKNIIVHGGSNIAPQEVESAFYRHPDVLEAGIIGVPSAIYGMNLKAFITLKANAPLISEHELREFIRPFLADYKLPETIVFLPSLPKGSSGKIDRHALESF
jgi:acyl-CoA synthetase (AMP-forming)/AMP-acid ligase II